MPNKPNNFFRTIFTKFSSILNSKALPRAENDKMTITQANDISFISNLLNNLQFKWKGLPKVKYKFRKSCIKEIQKAWRNNCKRSPLRNYLSQVPVNFRTMLTRFLSGLNSKTLPWAKNDEMAFAQEFDISYFYDLLNIFLLKRKNLKTIKYNHVLLDPSVHNTCTADFPFKYKWSPKSKITLQY